MRSATLIMLVAVVAGCNSTPTAVVDAVEEEYGYPDLTIQAFIPPIIMAGSGATIYLSDLVANVGDARSAAAIVRYYISDEQEVDVHTALVIGERTLRSLGPREVDESMELPFVIPAGLGSPPLYLAACADIDDTTDEINESNNCTTNEQGSDSMFMSPALFDGVGVIPDPE